MPFGADGRPEAASYESVGFMITYPQFFDNYTGKKVSFTGFSSNFNVGVVD